MVAITLHNKSHAWDGQKGNGSISLQKTIWLCVRCIFLNAIGVFMVFRIREVLLKRGEKTGTDAHTELYRMPYRIK